LIPYLSIDAYNLAIYIYTPLLNFDKSSEFILLIVNIYKETLSPGQCIERHCGRIFCDKFLTFNYKLIDEQ